MKRRTKRNRDKDASAFVLPFVYDTTRPSFASQSKLVRSGAQGVARNGMSVVNVKAGRSMKNVRPPNAVNTRFEKARSNPDVVKARGYAVQLDRDTVLGVDGRVFKGKVTRKQRLSKKA